jgi:signal transduction histidine kinase
LGGMKQRVEELGGHLTVDSNCAGTCVTATLPLPKAEQSTHEDHESGQAASAA